jgi:hypothetical protein
MSLEEKAKKEKHKEDGRKLFILIASAFIGAAILFWTWPVFTRTFPILIEKGIMVSRVSYWQAFGVSFFIGSFASLFRKKKFD